MAEAAFTCGVSMLVNAPDDWLSYVSSRMFSPKVGRWKSGGSAGLGCLRVLQPCTAGAQGGAVLPAVTCQQQL